jgi:hypothetical protein
MKTLLSIVLFLVCAAAPATVFAQNSSGSELLISDLTPNQRALIEQLLNAAPYTLAELGTCYYMLLVAGVPEEIAQQVVAALGAIEKPQKD